MERLLARNSTQLQQIIGALDLNAQTGEMVRALYRKGLASHSDALRDARKVLFYAQAEVKRLEALEKPAPEFHKIEWWEVVLGFVVESVEIQDRVADVILVPQSWVEGNEVRRRLYEFGIELNRLKFAGGGRVRVSAVLPATRT